MKAIGGLLTPQEVKKACALLSVDVSQIQKEAREIKECSSYLMNVKDRHSPPYDNTGLRDGHGLAHGEYGWFLRLVLGSNAADLRQHYPTKPAPRKQLYTAVEFEKEYGELVRQQSAEIHTA